MGGIALLALLAAGAAFWFGTLAQAAQAVATRAADLAHAQNLAAEALAQVERDPDLGILLARASISITEQVQDAPRVPQAEAALRQGLVAAAPLLALRGHTGAVLDAAYSPDGHWIVTASADNTARIWDAATGQVQHTLTGHSDQVNSAAYSRDGGRIVTASTDGTARIWNAATGQALWTLTGHHGPVNGAAFSPDGQTVATVADKTVRLWDAQTGQPRCPAGWAGPDKLFSVVYAAGHDLTPLTLLTTSADGTAQIWDAGAGLSQPSHQP